MSKSKKEVEFPCDECRLYESSGKRELTLFPDGQPYMKTGTCNNPRSPLYRHILTGSFTVSVNAVHHRMARFSGIGCFVKKP